MSETSEVSKPHQELHDMLTRSITEVVVFYRSDEDGMKRFEEFTAEEFRGIFEQLEAQREVLGWIASECARMEEYHTGFKWIGRRIHGLWVDFPAASYPASGLLSTEGSMSSPVHNQDTRGE